jgi:hypothetical protein
MTIGLLPDAVKPGIHCVRTHWIRGFIAFCRAGRTGGLAALWQAGLDGG